MTSLVTLAKAGPPTVPVLVDVLKNGPPASRVLAAEALGLFAEPSTRPALEAALKDPQGQVRFHAARSLGMFGRLESTDQRRKILKNDPDWRVQVELAFALGRDDKPNPKAIRKQLAEFDLSKMDSAALGQAAPDFSLADSSGKAYSLREFRKEKVVVLVFRIQDT